MLKCAIFGKSKEIREEDRWCSERSREGTEVFMYKPFSSFHTTCNACMHGKRFFLIFLSFTTRKMKTKFLVGTKKFAPNQWLQIIHSCNKLSNFTHLCIWLFIHSYLLFW